MSKLCSCHPTSSTVDYRVYTELISSFIMMESTISTNKGVYFILISINSFNHFNINKLTTYEGERSNWNSHFVRFLCIVITHSTDFLQLGHVSLPQTVELICQVDDPTKAKRMTVAEAVKSVPDLVSLTCRSFYGHNSETTALTFRELYRIFTGDRQITHLTHVKVRVVLHLSRE